MTTPMQVLAAATGEQDMEDIELRFVEEYCVDLNPKRAAERCGTPKDKAAALGRRLLRKPEILEAIDVRLAALSQQSVVNAEWVRKRLKEMVERCMQAIPVMEKQKVEGEWVMVPTGEYKFDSNGANKALENLGKHLGMFAEQSVITVEHELKSLSQPELDARIARLIEEQRTLTLIPGSDGVYELEEQRLIQEKLEIHVEEEQGQPHETQPPPAEQA